MSEAPDQEKTIDLKTLIKSLAPDELAKFEPMSGLMLLNLSSTEFAEASRRFLAREPTEDVVNLMRIINHETYHFIQAGASGYVFDRQSRLVSTLGSSLKQALPDPAENSELKARIGRMRAFVGDASTFDWIGSRPR